jgi:phthiocerol/phenolphthiocerol synthesis type-I polyketide synthase E
MASNRHPKQERVFDEDIAIVGMSARFPGCRTVGEYWAKIAGGESLLTTPTSEELIAAGIDPATAEANHIISSGTTLEEAEWFDAKFFGMTRREAEIMDPQQRVFLECAYEALEDAGLAPDDARNALRVGVFGGIGMNTYMLQLLGNPEMLAAAGGYQLMLGNDKDFLATRVAFKLNLTGPAVAVQTACSTSLAAVHLACQSLQAGECDAALAGGVSIAFPQVAAYPYIPGMILSPDGVCRPFDAKAKGTVPGRGAGLVVLKRLADAEAAGDTVYAVIAGTAWNNDGSGKVGYTAPSVAGQAEVIRAAQAAAGISPDKISYVEAHGTGTELGDPIEVAALAEVFGAGKANAVPCILGSVKANMGHADVAAGVAGLIKAALAIHHGVIPGTPHFEQANPALGLERTRFQVSATNAAWPEGETEHWAGVSSFGIGGTNVHVCLRSHPVKIEPSASTVFAQEPRIFPISAQSPAALSSMELRLSAFLTASSDEDLAPVASTLQSGRRLYPFRRAVVAGSREELAQTLAATSSVVKKDGNTAAGELAPKVAFLFPGQGQQFDGMAAELYERDISFRNWIDRGLACLEEDLSAKVLAAVRGGGSAALNGQPMETALAQPLLFLAEYALAMRWMELGIRPDALLGHSLGELTAAAVAGVFSFEDAMHLAVERGRLMQDTPEGAMLAVSLPVDQVAPYLTEELWIAAENGPKLTVLSGSLSVVGEAEKALKSARVATVRLQSNRAFHAPGMSDAASSFAKSVSAVERKAPKIPWLSNVTGTWITAEEAMSPQYWADQVTSRVRFAENAGALAGTLTGALTGTLTGSKAGSKASFVLLEVGPGDALGTLARQQDRNQVALTTLGKGPRESPNQRGALWSFLSAAAQLWERGFPLKWEKLPGNATTGIRRVALPTYPFERERFWVERTEVFGGASGNPQSGAGNRGFQKRKDVASWFYAPSWQRTPAAAIANIAPREPVANWILVCGDAEAGEGSFVSKLAAGLATSGCQVLTVAADSKQTFDELLHTHADTLTVGPNGLLYYLSSSNERASSEAKTAIALEAYAQILDLLKTAVKARTRFHQFELILENLTEVNGETVEQPERAILEGLARVLPVEFRGMVTRSIDPGVVARSNSQLAAELVISEVQTVAYPGATVAYRGASRWSQALLPVRVEEPAKSRIRVGGTYVITGGLGGVGYAIARHLMSRYGVKLALLGRTELPSRGGWEEWITEHGPQHPVSRRIERVKTLEALGGELLLLTTDIADPDELEAAWKQIEHKFGPVHGVIHAAGLSSSERFIAQTRASVATVFRPKVEGSKVVAELLARRSAADAGGGRRSGQTLDFLLFCSSISSVVPLVGATAYSAANVFQDRYACWCAQQLGLPAVVVNFDGWQEVGMIAETSGTTGFQAEHEARLKLAMTVEEGLQVLERVLASGERQLLVSTLDLPAVLAALIPSMSEGDGYSSSEIIAGEDPVGLSANGDVSHRMPASAETLAVIAIWRELLGADRIEPTDNFFELGGHSLVGTMVLARVREQFGVDLSIRAVFEAPTPESLGLRIREAEPVKGIETVRPEALGEEVVAGEDREDFEF